MKKIKLKCIPAILAVSALALLPACAVQSGPGGKVHVGIDNAELLGQQLGKFTLADGSEGTLRVHNGRYSIKLEKYFKVISIANALSARVVRTESVGGRTLVVIEKSERNCKQKTQLYSIQGSEVLAWDFGDCTSSPVIDIGADQATFDFVQSRRTARLTYREGRLFRSEIATVASNESTGVATITDAKKAAPDNAAAKKATSPTPNPPQKPLSQSTPTAAIDASSPRYVPGPPLKVGSVEGRELNLPVITRPVEKKPTLSPTARPENLPKALEFPAQEQKPVRIVLDK